MKMKKINIYTIFILSFLAAFPCGADAQNLDPTVVVSRDYEGKLIEVHKPKIDMAVPDSVLRFDLEFDYSVSDSPYKGAYDFTPYVLDMKPSPTYRHNGRLYLNAGAGYQLHPELDVVWSPALKSDSFRMNVYADHRSYIGSYWEVGAEDRDGKIVFDRVGKDVEERSWSGEDLVSKAGLNGKYDWDGGALIFDAGYYGIYQSDRNDDSRSFNAVDVNMGISSKKKADSSFGYSAAIAYRYGSDGYADLSIAENVLDIDASMDISLGKKQGVRLDVGYDMAGYSGYFASNVSLLSVSPHYVRNSGLWRFDVGLTVSSVFRGNVMSGMFADKIQGIYPDISVSLLAGRSLRMYVELDGGSRMNTYSSLLASDRRAGLLYGRGKGLLDMTDERFSAVFGLEGKFGKSFSYVLNGGYADFGNAPLDAIVGNLPAIRYGAYGKAFASLKWMLDAGCVDFDGFLEYASYKSKSDHIEGFMPAALTGNVSFRYNWKKRLYAGAVCDFSSARDGNVMMAYQDEKAVYIPSSIPGYADLGVEAEYLINRKFSVWAKGGNLLNMTIQRSLLYAEKGPYFTLGFCLNL